MPIQKEDGSASMVSETSGKHDGEESEELVHDCLDHGMELTFGDSYPTWLRAARDRFEMIWFSLPSSTCELFYERDGC